MYQPVPASDPGNCKAVFMPFVKRRRINWLRISGASKVSASGHCGQASAREPSPGQRKRHPGPRPGRPAARHGASRLPLGTAILIGHMDPHAFLSRLSADAPISGSSLAAELGVTRAAVWKQVEALRALGAPIEAEAGLGYRLAWAIEWLDEARIAAELEPEQRGRLGGIAVHWQVDSTSSDLQRRAASDDRDLLVCCAETQTAGRGRRGRDWRSPLGGNLYFSLLKRFDHGMGALTGLSLAVGTAVIAALADCGVADAGLKWPNDVLAGGRKLAGVLIELGGEFLGPCHAVIGIGVNLHLPDDVRAAIDQPATDIAALTGDNRPSRNRLAGRLLVRLIDTLDRFAEHGFGAIAGDYARADLLRGRNVRITAADGAHDGIAEGVDARGALRVRHGDVIVHYDSAEVSVRAR